MGDPNLQHTEALIFEIKQAWTFQQSILMGQGPKFCLSVEAMDFLQTPDQSKL